ncbi:hypothetical protein [Corallococcus macrosporus]|uniref:DUF4148 domain-containing protein n=1 Tax=Corallococcus macrosporus DSM 14697 TaxID=1189310 RepID=A0A250JZN5_9BACT|nr:hypothetical protein [Corallococcus macrosporus]ATB48957.1 hypothetical protein MYMAC_004590 [Corallococcus macrosporus DSM 14697]
MSPRTALFLVASWLVMPGQALAADSTELTPEKVAEIRRDEAQALSEVDEEYGNRKPSEMSTEERREAIDKQKAASASVLEKHGVSAKDYARYEARMSPADNARAKAEAQRLEEAAKAAKQPAPAQEEVQIQQGFNNENPVEVEATEGAAPAIEIGVPVE